MHNDFNLLVSQLRHLKRARREEGTHGSSMLEILMCPVSHEAILSEEIRTMFPETRHRMVCKEKPRTREEYMQWGRHWPVVFRPSEASEEQEKGLSPVELTQAGRYLNLLQQPQESVEVVEGGEEHMGEECLIVDPCTDQVRLLIGQSLA